MEPNDEGRTKIAQFCGWTNIFRKNSGAYGGLQGIKPGTDYFQIIPSYFTSLDAMHGAEKLLKPYDKGMTQFYEGSKLLYKNILWRMCGNDYVFADAKVRAVAFIETISKQ